MERWQLTGSQFHDGIGCARDVNQNAKDGNQTTSNGCGDCGSFEKCCRIEVEAIIDCETEE